MDDLLLRGARLIPLHADDNADGPAADALVDVRVRDGEVAEVGPGLAPDGAEVLDAEGRWLIPGLWDQHVHMAQWTLANDRLDLAGATSVEHAVSLVAARLEEFPDRPVVGWGHRPTAWPTDPGTAALDAIGTDQPIVLIAGDGHHGWLNRKALLSLHLPTRAGVVSEAEWFAAYGRLSTLTGGEETGPDAYRRTMEHAASMGVTGVVDFEFSGDTHDWAERWMAGADLLRVRVATYVSGLDAVIEEGLRTGDPIPGGDGLLTMGPLKIISDGSLNTRTAWCCDEYAGPSPMGLPFGQPNQTPEELRERMARGHAHGLEAAVHAIGDRAVAAALDAFEETGARGSIEHVQLTTRDDVRRMARLGVRGSVQPAHLLDDRVVTERLWPGRSDRCFALRWMADEGVELAFGSDAPVAVLDPWLAMASAVHRGRDDDAWHPEQSLTPREALAASTDGRVVAPGNPADLVLLDADPLTSDLWTMGEHVARTWVAGREIWSR